MQYLKLNMYEKQTNKQIHNEQTVQILNSQDQYSLLPDSVEIQYLYLTYWKKILKVFFMSFFCVNLHI